MSGNNGQLSFDFNAKRIITIEPIVIPEISLPETIRHPDAFKRSPPANFDGVFNWIWTRGCFGNTKIEPTDFDGVVERCFNYLIFETKDEGIEISQGQLWALERLRRAKSFTVMKIWGKQDPKILEMIYPDGMEEKIIGRNNIRQKVVDWFRLANSQRIINGKF